MSTLGWLLPVGIYGALLVLHRFAPARIVDGYLEDPATGKPMRYRINGLLVTVVAMLSWALGAALGLWRPEGLYLVRWEALGGACTLGLLYTFWVVLRAPPTGRGLFVDLFLGRRENIQHDGFVDAKMALYLLGATMLALNVLSFSAYHWQAFGAGANLGIYVSAALLLFFVFDYLWFERVHLYTYDLFAERVGFKLGWGCLVFYPYFYTVGLWGTVALPAADWLEPYQPFWLLACVLVFFCGWCLARGANLQKYWFKRDPDRHFLGIAPVTLEAGNQRLLCSGFWGAARHINYLGEVLMALGIAGAVGHPDVLWPWLYPLYYLALLVPRERDDDRRCAQKYGATWERYRERVPWRIVPGLY